MAGSSAARLTLPRRMFSRAVSWYWAKSWKMTLMRAAQVDHVELAQVDAVQGDVAGAGVVEAAEQLHQRGLARAVGPDEGGDLARADGEGDLLEGGRAPCPGS